MPHVEDIFGPGAQAGRLRIPHGLHLRPKPPPINYGAVATVGRQQRPQLPAMQPRQPNLLQMGPRPAPGLLQAPGFGGAMPTTRLPKLSKFEHAAIKAIHQSYNSAYKDPGRKANQLIFNPTPKMQVHIDNMVGGHLAHKMAVQYAQSSKSWMGDTGMDLTAKDMQKFYATPKGRAVQQRAQLEDTQAKAATMGFGNLHLGPVGGFAQRFGTDIAETVKQAPGGMLDLTKHAGMGLANVGAGALEAAGVTHKGGLGGPMDIQHPHYFASQKPYWEAAGKATLKSYTDMFTTGMIYKHPGIFFMNALSLASLGAGGAVRAAKISEVASALKAGDITAGEAMARTGQILRKPGPIERTITLGPDYGKKTTIYHGGPKELEGGALRVGDKKGEFYGGKGLFAQSHHSIADVYANTRVNGAVHELHVPENMISRVEDKLTKLQRKHLEDTLGRKLPKNTTVGDVFKLLDRPNKAVEDILKPVKGVGGKHVTVDQIHEGFSRAGTHGISFPPKTLDEDLANLYDMQGKDPMGFEAEQGYKDLEKSREFKLWQPDLMQAMGAHEPLVLHPPAVKGALGGLIQKHVFDKATERAFRGRNIGLPDITKNISREIPSVRNPLMGASAAGKAGKLMRQDAEMETNMQRSLAEIQELKKLGLPTPYDKVDAHHVPMPHGEGPPTLSQFLSQLPKGERKAQLRKYTDAAQAKAYAIGPTKVQFSRWNQLRKGGLSPEQSILKHNPRDYIGIKEAPTKLKDFKAFSSEKGVAQEWQNMVEHDTAKMLANPHAYTYYPRGMWQRLKPGMPGQGAAAGVMKTIDAVTQMVRSGRFLTPAYAAWFLQNGVLHLSQAGVYTLRNVNLLRTEFDKMSHEAKAQFDGSVGASHYGGGIARTGEGSESTPFLHPRIMSATHTAAKFWHAVDDRPWRRMSLIHELYREGYKNAASWEKLLHEDPVKFRSIARRAQKEAIDYSEMGPAERETFQKLFTAWGWTRGASTYTMRFPFQHPIQATLLNQAGQHGQKNMEKWWLAHGGIAPQWLEGYLPLSGGRHPLMGSTGILSPGETFSSMLEAIPGATVAQRSALSEEEAPAWGFLEGLRTGRDRFGRPLVGSQRVMGPVTDLLHRFRPIGMAGTLLGSKHGGGTFQQGPEAFLEGLTGLGLQRLRDPSVSSALGVKDYEQALPKPDEIQFRFRYGMERLPQQLELYRRKSGAPLDHGTIAQIKGDMAAVERRDMFQYKWASDRGAHSFRSLPAVDRAKAGIKFMLDHHYFTQSDARDMQQYMTQVHSERDMDQVASQIWGSVPIGQMVNQWNSMMKQYEPSPLQAARG